jgi:hypothetical protein
VVNPDKTYEVFTNCKWGNLNDPGVNVDRESNRNSRLPRQNYLRAAETFLMRGDKEKAVELLNTCLEFFPDNKIPYDMMMIPFVETYYQAEEKGKAGEIAGRLIEIYGDDLRYYNTLKPAFVEKNYKESAERSIRILRNISQLTKMYGDNELSAKADEMIASFR